MIFHVSLFYKFLVAPMPFSMKLKGDKRFSYLYLQLALNIVNVYKICVLPEPIFGIGKCEGMGGEGGGEDECRLIQSRKLRKRRDGPYGYQTLYSYCVTVVFHLFAFIPLIPNVDQRVISHNILIQSLFQQEGAQICFQKENWVSCKAQQSLPGYYFFLNCQ